MDFSLFAETSSNLESTSGRLEMIDILSKLFSKTKSNEVDKAIYLLQGQISPPFTGLDVGMGEKFVERSIALSSGYTQNQVELSYRKTGDLGKTAEEFLGKKKQMSLVSGELSLDEVYSTFLKISKTSGQGSQDTKIKLLAELLNRASPLEARYLVRIPLGKLQLGVGDPTILEALSKSKTKEGDKSKRDELERNYNLTSDLGMVAKNFFEGKKSPGIVLFNPIRSALCERENTPEDILKRHKTTSAEPKLDGFRIQIHKKGDKIRIFSRRLEDMTNSFPEVVKEAQEKIKAKEAIIDGEALAYNESTGELYSFQYTIQRKRKHGITEKAAELPLHVFAFDLLYLDGNDYTRKKYTERRKKLSSILKKGTITLAESLITDDPKKLQKFFLKTVGAGMEGLVCKSLDSEYKAGGRGFNWIKLKRSYRGELADTVDLLIVGYYLGLGSRARFKFGGLLGAVYNEKSDTFQTITRIGTGFTEDMMQKLQNILHKDIVKIKPARVEALIEPDFWVKPNYVITVMADEITESPMHTAGMKTVKESETGFALRFPRMIGDIRSDKKPEDATTVSEIIRLFKLQRKTEY